MLTRHMNELMARLERAGDIGCAEIRKPELLLWYGRDRMSKTLWADVLEKWQEVDDGPLLVGDAEGLWVLAYGKGLTAAKDSWFKDVRQLAGISIQTGDEAPAAAA